jgi:hypothetical protein
MKITLTQDVAEIGSPWKSQMLDVTNTKVEAAEVVEAILYRHLDLRETVLLNTQQSKDCIIKGTTKLQLN